jgi:cytoskeletal protein CcmA (bactofilin family)
MWKWTRKDENKPVPPSGTSGRPSAAPPAVSLPSQEPVQKILTPQSVDGFHPEVTHIGKSIVIKGELSGSENVYLDGELEGSIALLDGNLTVGPYGRIRANLQARSILVQGRVDGNLYGIERVELKKSAAVVGDIYTQRIVIEDGAQLKGSVLVQKDIPRPQTKKGDKPARE